MNHLESLAGDWLDRFGYERAVKEHFESAYRYPTSQKLSPQDRAFTADAEAVFDSIKNELSGASA